MSLPPIENTPCRPLILPVSACGDRAFDHTKDEPCPQHLPTFDKYLERINIEDRSELRLNRIAAEAAYPKDRKATPLVPVPMTPPEPVTKTVVEKAYGVRFVSARGRLLDATA